MVDPIDSSNIVERAIDIHLARMRRLKDLHEMKLFRAENILLKKKFIEQQKANNYRMEYDRLRSTLSNNVFKRVMDMEKDKEKRETWSKLLEADTQEYNILLTYIRTCIIFKLSVEALKREISRGV